MADEIATLISSAGLTNETFLVLCVIAVIVIGAIVVIITSRPILDIYPYLTPVSYTHLTLPTNSRV